MEAHLGVVPTLKDDFTQLLLPVKLLEYVHMGLPAVAPRLPVIERYFSDAELHSSSPDRLLRLPGRSRKPAESRGSPVSAPNGRRSGSRKSPGRCNGGRICASSTNS